MIKNKADFGFIYPHVAKLDIAADSDSEGRGFESLRAGQKRNLFLISVKSRFLTILR